MKTINLRWIYPHYRHDEFVEVSDEVWEAMRQAQRRRFLLYAPDGLTLAEIGTVCGCSKVSVYESIDAVRKKFLKFFANYHNECPLFWLPSERDCFPYPSGRRTADKLPASPIFRR